MRFAVGPLRLPTVQPAKLAGSRFFVFAAPSEMENPRMTDQSDMDAHYFVSLGCEYYANARFAMHAQRSWVCGNLFHHSVETLLKAGLAKSGKDLPALKRMGHSLEKLWQAAATTIPRRRCLGHHARREHG
jgi:hypothetical protein